MSDPQDRQGAEPRGLAALRSILERRPSTGGEDASARPSEPRAASTAAPRTAERDEACEFCSVPIGEDHPHCVDLEDRGLLCVCRPCYLLFLPDGAGGERYRSVPERYRHIERLELSDAQWEALQLPIRIAFFFENSQENRTVAFYPSPAGATESLLPLEQWRQIVGQNPLLGDLQPDVEALLLYRHDDGDESSTEGFLVPIDSCYELVGTIRASWQGFAGGKEAWERIDGFFGALRDRGEGTAWSAG